MGYREDMKEYIDGLRDARAGETSIARYAISEHYMHGHDDEMERMSLVDEANARAGEMTFTWDNNDEYEFDPERIEREGEDDQLIK